MEDPAKDFTPISDRAGANAFKTSALGRPLTRRQREVLYWMALGLHNKEIAQKTGLSPYTVKNHAQEILARTGARDRTHAALMAFGCYAANCPRNKK